MNFLLMLAGVMGGVSAYYGCEYTSYWVLKFKLRELEGGRALFSDSTIRAFHLGAGGLGAVMLPLLMGWYSWGVLLAAFMLGCGLIWLYQHERQKKKIWNQTKALPDFLDLFSLCLSAGYELQKSWALAASFLPNDDFKKELELTSREMALGKSVEEALKGFSKRCSTSQGSTFWILMTVALQQGVPLQQMALDEAESIRNWVMIEIEKKAQTAPVRLLFPIVFFIFPSLFLALFGPLYLYYRLNGFL